VWREVLLASLVLQVLALALPLVTQVVIEKVIVHRTESTLIALGVGMLVFVVFTGLLGWVRQYLILHTGNRIDAVLGANVFDHLFKLPPLYFQHRPTGVIAARLQGIDLVQASVTCTLGSNLENLTLTGSGAINGTGNSAANVLIGNGAVNTLTGMSTQWGMARTRSTTTARIRRPIVWCLPIWRAPSSRSAARATIC